MDEPVVYSNLMQMPYSERGRMRKRLADSSFPGKTDLLLVAERDGKIVGSAACIRPTPRCAAPRATS